jgi:hypothetical protein
MHDESIDYLQDKYEDYYSPFTMRDYAEVDPAYIDCNEVERVLSIFGVSRIIVGHMPSLASRIRFNCRGLIVLTDIASSRYMFGFERDEHRYQPNILEMNFHPETGGLINMVSILVDRNGQFVKEEVYDSAGPRYMSINEWARSSQIAHEYASPWRKDIWERILKEQAAAAALNWDTQMQWGSQSFRHGHAQVLLLEKEQGELRTKQALGHAKKTPPTYMCSEGERRARVNGKRDRE